METTKWLISDKWKSFFLRMSKRDLQYVRASKPRFPKKGVYKYANTNNFPVETLQFFCICWTKAKDRPVVRLNPKWEKNLTTGKMAIGKVCKDAQSASNYSSYATPLVTRNTLTIGTIPNPYGIFQVSPVLSSGEGSWTECLQTWENPDNKFRKCQHNLY